MSAVAIVLLTLCAAHEYACHKCAAPLSARVSLSYIRAAALVALGA